MLFSTDKKTGLLAGILVSAIAVSCATASYAQSTTATPGGVSDTDYLSALSTMSAGMDLSGLAGQTHEPTTVAIPQLPTVASGATVELCDALLAQAEASGHQIEIFGADTTLSDSELAALSTCVEPDTGIVVSYLIPAS